MHGSACCYSLGHADDNTDMHVVRGMDSLQVIVAQSNDIWQHQSSACISPFSA